MATPTLITCDGMPLADLPKPYYLGPIDHACDEMLLLTVVFVYEACEDTTKTLTEEQVAAALRALLKYYPHLSGRLEILAGHRLSVSDIGRGIELSYAAMPVTLATLSKQTGSGANRYVVSDFPQGCNELLPPPFKNSEELCAASLLRVRLTDFACGGVALGFSLSHAVSDAGGLFQMVANFAELYRNLNKGNVALSRPPANDRYMASLMDQKNWTPEARAEALAHESQYFFNIPTKKVSDSLLRDVTATDCTGRVFRFTKQVLADLKAEATAPDAEASGNWVTTYDALAAHVFRHVHQARRLLQQSTSSDTKPKPAQFLVPVNLRGGTWRVPTAPVGDGETKATAATERDVNGIPETYTGNGILCPFEVFDDAELTMDSPLWRLAARIHSVSRTKSKVTTDELERTCRWLAAQETMELVSHRYLHDSAGLIISQWNRFDAYNAGYLHRRPCFVCQPFTLTNLVDGVAFFLFTETPGDVDVSLVLTKDSWTYFNRDGDFMRSPAAEAPNVAASKVVETLEISPKTAPGSPTDANSVASDTQTPIETTGEQVSHQEPVSLAS